MGARSLQSEKRKALSPGTKAMKQVVNRTRQAKRRALPELNQHDQQARRKQQKTANSKEGPKPKAGAAAEGAEAEAEAAKAEAEAAKAEATKARAHQKRLQSARRAKLAVACAKLQDHTPKVQADPSRSRKKRAQGAYNHAPGTAQLGAKLTQRKLPRPVALAFAKRDAVANLARSQPCDWSKPTWYVDASSAYKWGWFSSKLISCISQSKRCEACNYSGVTNPRIEAGIQQNRNWKPSRGNTKPNSCSTDAVLMRQLSAGNARLSGHFCGDCFQELQALGAPFDKSRTRRALLCHQPRLQVSSLSTYDLPELTMSEEMILARTHVRVAVHMVRSGNLVYKGQCMFLQKESAELLVGFLWDLAALPIVVARFGDVSIGDVTHSDFLIRPDVVLHYWQHLCKVNPQDYFGNACGAVLCSNTCACCNFQDMCNLKVGDKWCGAAVQEPPGGWDRAKAGTCVINAASVLPCLEVPDAALADAEAAVAAASAAGAKAKVHTGAHGPLGPREHPQKDCRANMMYSTVPLGSSDSLPLGTLTSLVAEELAAQAELLRPNEAGISTGASPSPSPRIRPVSAPPTPAAAECRPASQPTLGAGSPVGGAPMQTPSATRPSAKGPAHTSKKPAAAAANNIRGLSGVQTDVPSRANAQGLPVHARLADMPRSLPVVPGRYAHAPAVERCCYQQPQAVLKVSLFSQEGRDRLVQKSFPSLAWNGEFDYFSKARQMNREKMLVFLMHYTTSDGHRPFAEHPTFMYCMLNINLRLSMDKVKFVVADRAFEGKTIENIYDDIQSGDKSVFKRVRGFTSSMVGSQAYWKRFRGIALAQLQWKFWRDNAMPTIFWTFTPADNWWGSFFERCLPPDATNTLANLGGQDPTACFDNNTTSSAADTLERQRLVARHVAAAVEHYYAMLDVFKHGFLECGLGATDHLHRTEGQGRKVFHEHGTSNIEGAPSPSTLQRACDFFQTFSSTNLPQRRLVPGRLEERQAVEEVLEYVANALELTGGLGQSCTACQADTAAVGIADSTVELKSSLATCKDPRSRWLLIRQRFIHKHNRRYCLKPRKCTLPAEGLPDERNAPREFLKCRFHFFFRTCACKHCQKAGLCEPHAEAADLEVAKAKASLAGVDLVEVACVCAEAKGCTCQCGASCSTILAGPHIHVTRNSRDDGSARHFRMHPIMDNGAFNCTIEAAMSAFGCMIDIQFLIDPTKAVEYVVKYLSKPETDGVHLSNTLTKMVKRCAAEATAPQNVASRLLNAYITERGYGNWETAALAMGLDLQHLSRPMQSLNTTGNVSVVVADAGESDSFSDADAEMPQTREQLKSMESMYNVYATRDLLRDKGWYWCKSWASTDLKKVFNTPAVVKVNPNPRCCIGRPLENGEMCEKDKEKLAGWCENRMMVHLPWFRDHNTLVGGHAGWIAAFRSHLPAWVLELEAALELGSVDLPLWPLEPAANSAFPAVVLVEFAQALLERGYLRVERDWDSEDCAGQTSESEDDVAEQLSDASSGDEGPTFHNEPSCGDQDGEDEASGSLNLDDLCNDAHDWVAESTSTLAALGMTFAELQGWLDGQKKACDALQAGALPKQCASVGEIAAAREKLMHTNNMNQREIFDFICAHAAEGTHFDAIIQGPAGCGKSFIYETLLLALGNKITFMAPTGVAALLIGGETIHRGLGIKVKGAGLDPLQNLASWQAEFDGVDIFAFDESSMMGRATVGRVIYRLDEIKGEGNYSILFTGDAMQLPPVKQLPMWAKDPVQGEADGSGSDNDAAVGAGVGAQKKSKRKGKQREDKADAHGYASYQARFEEHATVFVLRDSFRQQSDPAFRDEVMRLRQEPKVTQVFKKDSHGNATSHKLKKPKVALDFGAVQHGYWASRHLANLSAQGDDDSFDDALRMFDVNSVKNPKANLWNESKFRRLVAGTSGVAVYKSVAQHNASNKARATSKAANAKDGKYHKHLYLAAGAHVMVRNNMWTEGGVVNGAMGILRHLVVDPADNSVDTDGIRPVVALVEMDNFKCANPLVPSQPKLVPIRMCTHEWTVGHGKYSQACSRTQLPLELAWAITIHKSQGLTIGPGHNIQKVVIDVGATEHWAPGLLYVAVSRANNLGCIAFDPIRITECGQIEHLDFYAIERFARLNSSNGSQKTFAHLRHLNAMQDSRRQQN